MMGQVEDVIDSSHDPGPDLLNGDARDAWVGDERDRQEQLGDEVRPIPRQVPDHQEASLPFEAADHLASGVLYWLREPLVHHPDEMRGRGRGGTQHLLPLSALELQEFVPPMLPPLRSPRIAVLQAKEPGPLLGMEGPEPRLRLSSVPGAEQPQLVRARRPRVVGSRLQNGRLRDRRTWRRLARAPGGADPFQILQEVRLRIPSGRPMATAEPPEQDAGYGQPFAEGLVPRFSFVDQPLGARPLTSGRRRPIARHLRGKTSIPQPRRPSQDDGPGRGRLWQGVAELLQLGG